MRYIGWLSTLMTIILVSGCVWAAPAQESVILHYSFDEIINGIVFDQSGNGIHGTVRGTVDPVEGMRGSAGKFAGSSFIDIKDFPLELIPKDEITLTAWISVSAGDIREIFNAQGSDGTWIFHPEVRTNGKYRWLVRTSNMQTVFDMQVGTVVWDEWVHFAAVYSATEGYGALYINGEEISKQVVSRGMYMMQDWDMGARVGLTIDDARPFGGLMDDFIIWNKALSSDEIKLVMENGTGI